MKFPAAQYLGSGTYLAVYNYHSDISVSLPESVDAKHVAHVKYAFQGSRRGFDVFQVKPGTKVDRFLNVGKEIYPLKGGRFKVLDLPHTQTFKGSDLRGVDEKYDIQADVLNGPYGEVVDMARVDIEYFCRGRAAKDPEGSRIERVQRIIPVTKLRRITPEWIVTAGKSDFVPQCVFVGNIDYGDGCVSGWRPGEGAKFDGTNFTDYFLSPWGECAYCYAMPDHKSFPKTIKNIDFAQLKRELLGEARLEMGKEKPYGKKIEVMRFGKRTEASLPFPFGQEMLARTLEVMAETGTRGVMPTKFHEFNPEMAELFRRTNTTLLYSVGFPKSEPVPLLYGRTNEWRMEQAVKHNEAGVKTALYVLIHAHFAPGEREIKILDFAEKQNLQVQLLPMRYGNRNLFREMTNMNWADAKSRDQASFDNDKLECRMGCGDVFDIEAGKLAPKRGIHESWTNMVGDNKGRIQMCYHNEALTYCGGCLQQEGAITPTVKIQLADNPYRNQRRKKEQEKKAAEKLRNAVVPTHVQVHLPLE